MGIFQASQEVQNLGSQEVLAYLRWGQLGILNPKQLHKIIKIIETRRDWDHQA